MRSGRGRGKPVRALAVWWARLPLLASERRGRRFAGLLRQHRRVILAIAREQECARIAAGFGRVCPSHRAERTSYGHCQAQVSTPPPNSTGNCTRSAPLGGSARNPRSSANAGSEPSQVEAAPGRCRGLRISSVPPRFNGMGRWRAPHVPDRGAPLPSVNASRCHLLIPMGRGGTEP